MKSVLISSATVSSKDELYKLIKEALGLPDYCGNTLDSLYDCLGDIFEEFEITLNIDDALREMLGKTLDGLISMLSDLDRSNSHLILNMHF